MNGIGFNPMMMMMLLPGLGMAAMQIMQFMQMSQMMKNFGGQQQQGGCDPMQMMGGMPNQMFMNGPQCCPCPGQGYGGAGNISPAYMMSNPWAPERTPFNVNPELSSAGQMGQVRDWSRDNFAPNGIGPNTSMNQDKATNKFWTGMYEKTQGELLDNLKSHPEEKPIHKQIFQEVDARVQEMRNQGKEVTEGQIQKMRTEALLMASRDGRLSPDTGRSALTALKAINRGNQAQTDTFIKGGMFPPPELRDYVRTSQFMR